MTTSTPGFEFKLPVEGIDVTYLVSPDIADDGSLRKLTIWNHASAADSIADIAISPEIFKQFAMPNVETVCRIAIAQAAIEGAFSQVGAANLMLDFAIEPWEGELAPV
ncbi:hypothetical protein [Actimicrobium antarcticum]